MEQVKRISYGITAGVVISVLISAGVWAMSVAIPWKTPESGSAVANFCQWLYDSPIGSGIRESLYLFPIVEGVHLLGIALSVGAICWFDLRLMGLVFKDEPASVVWTQMMPLALVGFALMFVTGVLLFWAEAATAYHSVHFWIKVALLGMAGINAAVFEFKTHYGMAVWDKTEHPPASARTAGLLSLIFWTLVIVTGRTMAYTF